MDRRGRRCYIFMLRCVRKEMIVGMPMRWRDLTPAVIFIEDKRANPEALPARPGMTMPVNFMGYEPELS